MNYENPLGTQNPEPEGMSGMEMAGLAALTLGTGLAGKKVFDGVRKGIGNVSEYAKDIGKSVQTTKPGRAAADAADYVAGIPGRVRNAGHALREFEGNFGNSFTGRLYNSGKYEDLVKDVIGRNQVPLSYKFGTAPLNNEAVRDSLLAVIKQAKKPRDFYSPRLGNLSKKEIENLSKQFTGLDQADINAMLMFGNDFKRRAGLGAATTVDNWDYPVGILSELLNKA